MITGFFLNFMLTFDIVEGMQKHSEHASLHRTKQCVQPYHCPYEQRQYAR